MEGILRFKLVGLDNKNSRKALKNSLKQLKPNSPWAYIRESLSKGYLRLRFERLIFGVYGTFPQNRQYLYCFSEM